MKIILILFSLSAILARGEVMGQLIAPDSTHVNFSTFVVWIPDSVAKDLPAKNEIKIMGQKDKQFTPAFLAVSKGSSVHFRNDDSIFHNVFSLNPQNKFDLGTYLGGKLYDDNFQLTTDKNPTPLQKFSNPGKVHVFCNIHPDMMGIVYVFDKEIYAIPDPNGVFSLPGVNAGEYSIKIDGLYMDSPQGVKVKFQDDAVSKIKVNVRSTAKVIGHKRKDGTDYKKKYDDYDEKNDEYY